MASMAKGYYWRSMLKLSREGRPCVAKPKMFATAAAKATPVEGHPASTSFRAEFAPIYIVLGMVGVAVMMATHTAKQQLMHSPSVQVSKQRREMVHEVDNPEHSLNAADKFLNKSFLRKVAHIQEDKRTLPDPVRANPYTRARDAETLKSAGVRGGRN
ncbi:hypothetical protein MLD38_022895 [Melastoma candidum]|uniref:Uncharacterized protein n=1 Tax=Melastoma candidum TaxID=119954 RepID=A0ACB9QKP2_9MYRT|nr:hypothetical protein MLD38_022895 [Melastoma candidum]